MKALTSLDEGARTKALWIGFDLELSGSDRCYDEIVEIAMVVWTSTGVSVGEFTSRINIDVDIHPSATAVHGIRASDLVEEPLFPKVLENINIFLTNCFEKNPLCDTGILVAHNGNTVSSQLLLFMRSSYSLSGRFPFPACCASAARNSLTPKSDSHCRHAVSTSIVWVNVGQGSRWAQIGASISLSAVYMAKNRPGWTKSRIASSS